MGSMPKQVSNFHFTTYNMFNNLNVYKCIVYIVFLAVTLLKWHIIYCNKSNIKEDMNE